MVGARSRFTKGWICRYATWPNGGVSAPMLSQVERGDTSPTLEVATKIAAGLELNLSQLLRLDEGNTVTVVKAGTGRSGGGSGHSYELLTPPLPGQRVEISLHLFGAKAP